MAEQPRESARCGWCLALGHTTATCPAGRALLRYGHQQPSDPIDAAIALRDAENPL